MSEFYVDPISGKKKGRTEIKDVEINRVSLAKRPSNRRGVPAPEIG